MPMGAIPEEDFKRVRNCWPEKADALASMHLRLTCLPLGNFLRMSAGVFKKP